MSEIMEVISNYGVGFACVGYLIYFQSTTMSKMLDTLSSINTRLTVIEEKLGSERHEQNN